MELTWRKKQKRKHKLQTLSGFLSFLLGLIALAGLNMVLIYEPREFPEIILYQLPIVGLFLGGFGLITSRRSRLYAYWGIGINIFILVFTLLMFVLAWSINPKP